MGRNPYPMRQVTLTLTVKWETTLTAKATGDYNLGVETDGYFRVSSTGKPVVTANYPHGVETMTGKAHREAGRPYRSGGVPEAGDT